MEKVEIESDIEDSDEELPTINSVCKSITILVYNLVLVVKKLIKVYVDYVEFKFFNPMLDPEFLIKTRSWAGRFSLTFN